MYLKLFILYNLLEHITLETSTFTGSPDHIHDHHFNITVAFFQGRGRERIFLRTISSKLKIQLCFNFTCVYYILYTDTCYLKFIYENGKLG